MLVQRGTFLVLCLIFRFRAERLQAGSKRADDVNLTKSKTLQQGDTGYSLLLQHTGVSSAGILDMEEMADDGKAMVQNGKTKSADTKMKIEKFREENNVKEWPKGPSLQVLKQHDAYTGNIGGENWLPLYHVTEEKWLADIQKHGLVPRTQFGTMKIVDHGMDHKRDVKASGEKGNLKDVGSYVYMTRWPWTIARYAQIIDTPEPQKKILLRTWGCENDCHDEHSDHFYEERKGFEEDPNDNDAVRTKQTILPADLQVYPWDTTSKTWGENNHKQAGTELEKIYDEFQELVTFKAGA